MKILAFLIQNKTSKQKRVMLLLLLFAFNTGIAQHTTIDKTVVKNFSLERYLGTWYEIARYDHYFERDMVGVTANYSFRNDGKLKVVNSGYKKTLTGKKSEAIGKAKIPDTAVPAKLKVSFFWFFYGDYFVLEIDKNYQWAIVGSNNDNYLWILSRTPQMDQKQYQQLLELISKRGYNTQKLIVVAQNINSY